MASELLFEHDIIPDLISCHYSKLGWLKTIGLRCQRETHSRCNFDIRLSGDKLCAKMVKVISEAGVLDGLIGLLGECDDFVVVTVQLGFFNRQVFINRLQLVSFVYGSDVSLLFPTFVPLVAIFLRCCDERVLPTTGVLEGITVSNLKDFRVVRNLIWYTRIDDNFLVIFDELSWVLWLLTVE